MSSFINSHLIEPVVRHARRFSFTPSEASSTDVRTRVNSEPVHVDNLMGDQHVDIVNDVSSDVNNCGLNLRPDLSDIREDATGPRQQGGDVQIPGASSTNPDTNTTPDGHRLILPLDDLHSNFIYETPPVLSPASELPEQIPSASQLREDEARTLDSLRSMSIDHGPRMTMNPSLAVSDRLRSHDGTSIHSGISRTSGERLMVNSTDSGSNGTREEGFRTASPAMSGKLPEDDGMKGLRQQIHQIRDMALSAEEKAKRMHELMTADYAAFKIANAEGVQGQALLNVGLSISRRTSVSGGSHRSASPSNIKTNSDELTVNAGDLKPTYAPHSPGGAETSQNASYSEDEEEDRTLGCKHYKRNVKIQCIQCLQWYTCRHCHDEMEDHALDRKGIRNMLCMLCGHAQQAAEYCRQCGEHTADYFCGICKLWDNDPRRKIYHCNDCGICRRGEGLGKDYVHCKRCNVCISIAWVATHRCVERATECDCPICGEWMFTSSAAVVAMRCGHYIHRKCYDAYMHTSYKCPICNRSAVNMELQWRKLDRHIEGQPMPSQFAHTKVWVTCNDCAARSCTAFHWLGNKCTACDSYNTNEVKLVNSPSQHEAEAVANAERQRMLETTESSSIPLGNAVDPRILTPPIAPAAVDQRSRSMENTADPNRRRTPIAPSGRASIDQSAIDVQPRESPQPYTSNMETQDISPEAIISRATQAAPLSTYSAVSPSGAELQMTDVEDEPSYTEPPSRDETDDVAFWGEPISPNGWTMPSLPNMPSIPDMPLGMPAMPNTWSMPNMPNMPTMPTMPTMPISPLSSWSSPRFFAERKTVKRGQGETQDDGQGDEGEGEVEDEDDSDDDMTWDEDEEGEGEEDGDVDEMELFGHR